MGSMDLLTTTIASSMIRPKAAIAPRVIILKVCPKIKTSVAQSVTGITIKIVL
jgi:hypothetical protein